MPAAVWLVFAAALLLAARFVHLHGVDIPFEDEWDQYVPRLNGTQPLTWEWLWRQHNEHRLALPRLVVPSLLEATGYSYRAVMFFNLALVGGATALLIWLAARLRGRASLEDAFFPLAMLHLGPFENLLWATQFQVLVVPALVALLLALVLAEPPGRAITPVRAGAVSLLLLLLIGSCAMGLAFVPPVVLWLIYRGVRLPRPLSIQGGTVFLVAALSLAATAYYFVGLKRVHRAAPSPGQLAYGVAEIATMAFGRGVVDGGPAATVATSLLLLAAAVGCGVWYLRTPEGRGRGRTVALILAGAAAVVTGCAALALRGRTFLSPFLPLSTLPLLVGFGVLLAAVVLALVRAARGGPGRRSAALGLLAVTAGTLVLLLGIAHGRSSAGPGVCLAARYTSTVVLLPVCLYLGCLLAGGPYLRRFGPLALALAALALFPFNRAYGRQEGVKWWQTQREFVSAARAGTPVTALASLGAPRYAAPGDAIFFPGIERLEQQIPFLRRAGIAPFTATPDDPPTEELALRADGPSRLTGFRREGNRLIPEAKDARATWRVTPTGAAARDVYGLTLRVAGKDGAPPDESAERMRSEFAATPCYRVIARTEGGGGRGASVTEALLLADRPAVVRLYPNGPVTAVEIHVVPGWDGALPPPLTLGDDLRLSVVRPGGTR